MAGPSSARASTDLAKAIAAHQKGDAVTADALYRRVLTREPENAEALHLLGVVAYQRGQHEDAVRLIRSAIRINPGKAEHHSNLSLPLRESEQYEDALRAAAEAVRLKPDWADAHANHGLALMALRRPEEAVRRFLRAIELKPRTAGFYNNLGNAYRGVEQYAEAETAYRAALAIRPDHAPAMFGLGVALDELRRPQEALDVLEGLLAIDPKFVEAHVRMSDILFRHGLAAEGIRSLDRALEVDPEHLRALYFSVFYQNYLDEVSASDMLTRARAFSQRMIAKAPAAVRLDNDPDPDRLLRVGLLSADLHAKHPVGYFSRALVDHIDRQRFQLFGYDTGRAKTTFSDSFDGWRNLEGLRDAAAADLIRRDEIDILIDLGGYTDGSRPDILSIKPAPIQAAWLGYSGTTGNRLVDYIIADRWVIPPGEEGVYSEDVVRLPDSYLCWTPGAQVPVAPLPAAARGTITFGSFNNAAKISPATMRTWARVLASVPQSRLVIKAARRPDPKVIARLHAALAADEVDPSRLEVLAPVPERDGHLAQYGRVDIGLDPFPYNGTTTTIEALWMGVPVLTLSGDRFIAHVGESILRTMQMPEWIASDTRDYVRKAVVAASDLAALAKTRAGLRSRLIASPLGDAPRFARNFEAALRGMWVPWCATQRSRAAQ